MSLEQGKLHRKAATTCQTLQSKAHSHSCGSAAWTQKYHIGISTLLTLHGRGEFGERHPDELGRSGTLVCRLWKWPRPVSGLLSSVCEVMLPLCAFPVAGQESRTFSDIIKVPAQTWVVFLFSAREQSQNLAFRTDKCATFKMIIAIVIGKPKMPVENHGTLSLVLKTINTRACVSPCLLHTGPVCHRVCCTLLF